MVREILEQSLPRPQRSLIPIAAIGAIVSALALSGCGRKGALDPPPGGYQIERGIGRTPVTSRGAERPVEKQPEYDQDGRPIAPSGARKRLPGDWLID
jgi:hypothetical protein